MPRASLVEHALDMQTRYADRIHADNVRLRAALRFLRAALDPDAPHPDGPPTPAALCAQIDATLGEPAPVRTI